jgi:hypothetical protein
MVLRSCRDVRDIGKTLRWISDTRSAGAFHLYGLASPIVGVAIRTDQRITSSCTARQRASLVRS